MILLIIVIYLIGYLVAYLLGRQVITDGEMSNWTVGGRMFFLFWGVLSWVMVIILLSVIIQDAKNSDKPAKW